MRRFILMAVLLLMTLCFQSSPAWSLDRFVDLNDGTVLDTTSSLRWLKNANCTDTAGGIAKADGYLNWADAQTWSNNLASGLCGLSDGSTVGDWHLPTIDELRIFTDAGYRYDTLNAAGFTGVQGNYYWSSSTYAYITFCAWSVGMVYGSVDYRNKTDYGYVWPVRGGQYWSLDSLIISGTAGFGSVPVGSTSSGHLFTLKNSGANQLSVASITLSGADSGQFTLTTGGTSPCSSLTSLTLNGGASCTVLVSSKPTIVGNRSANLTVTTTTGSANIPLTVIGLSLPVTYSGNGNSSGNVPVDSTGYTLNATVTVLDNSGGLAKSGYSFNGWNTAADGSGTTYQPGATFSIAADTSLYAKWAVAITPPSGLVSWWRAEGDALDTTGGLVGTAASGMTYTAGKVGQAFSFSGVFGDVSPAYVTIPDNPRLNFGTDEFSIAVWIKTTVAGEYKRIVIKRIPEGATAWYSLAAHNGKILFETGVNNITSVATVADGQWHHVTVTRDPASSSPRKYHLYIDGVEDASVADSGANLDNPCPLELGKWHNINYYTGIYSGQIDELQFFSRALAAAEVQYIYNAGSSGLALTPTITEISPSSGFASGGTTVTITGSGLNNATAVKFDAADATGFSVSSDTQATATSPAGIVGQTVDLTVTTPGGTSATNSADLFTYTLQYQAKNQTTGTSYTTLAEAISVASTGHEIRAYSGQFDGAFILGTSLNLYGGYDDMFNVKGSLPTTLNGSLTVNGGTAKVDSVTVKGVLTIKNGSLQVSWEVVRAVAGKGLEKAVCR